MLKAMVTSCSHWMVAGLPIKEFSIVLYHKGSAAEAQKANSYLVKDFADLKRTVNEKLQDIKQEVAKYSHDFFFCYSKNEANLAEIFHQLVSNSHFTSVQKFFV